MTALSMSALPEEDASLRATLRELPSTLNATQKALASTDAMASELGPTLEALRPGARALGPSLRETRPFLRGSTPIIRDEIRPFVRAARPAVSDLRPALRDLADAPPDLTRTFKVVNALLNTLAISVSTAAPAPILVVSPSPLRTAMLRGTPSVVSFSVANVGALPSGDLLVILPTGAPWLSLVSTQVVASLLPGQSNIVTLALTPPADIPA